MAQIGIAWVLAKDAVTAPIVGTTNVDNMKDILGKLLSIRQAEDVRLMTFIAGLDVQLTAEEMKYLEEPYQPTAIFGH